MFTKVLVFVAFLSVVSSAPSEEPVAIIAQDSDIQPDGTFQWSFESADGTKQEQSGSIKPGENDETVSSVKGSASWTDPEGNKHEISYLSDENGFQPQGADIPQAPEVPPQIARALEWIAAHPEAEEKAA